MFLEHNNFTWLTGCGLLQFDSCLNEKLRVVNWLCCRLGECLQCWKAWRYHRQARTMLDLMMPITSQKCFSECLLMVLLLTSLQREKLVTPNLWNGCLDIGLNRCLWRSFPSGQCNLMSCVDPTFKKACLLNQNLWMHVYLGEMAQAWQIIWRKCMLMCTSSHFSLIF